MDDNFVWCALIFALAYIGRNMLPSYYELTSFRRHSLDNMHDEIMALEDRADAISDAVDDSDKTMLAMGKKLGEVQSDVAGHLTRIDDLAGSAIVGLRAVNVLDESNVAVRHVFQFLVGEKWIDVPVENVWQKADDHD
jgi:hypothetical protein